MTDRRAELLAGATVWVLDHGLAELSLRPLARALGTSDRMLLYYFDSKDILVAEVSRSAAEMLVTAMPTVGGPDAPTSARRWLEGCWDLFTDPALRPAMALLFELDAAGARAPGGTRDAASAVARQWLGVVDSVLVSVRVKATPKRRQSLAKVVAAAFIGLVLDALIADDPSRPTAELKLLADLVDAAR